MKKLLSFILTLAAIAGTSAVPINAVDEPHYWVPDNALIQLKESTDRFDREYTREPELLDMFNAYTSVNGMCSDDASVLWLAENGDSYSQFSYLVPKFDTATMMVVEDDGEIDMQSFYGIKGFEDAVADVRTERSEIIDKETSHGVEHYVHTGKFRLKISIDFSSQEHEKNVAMLMKLRDMLSEGFTVDSWTILITEGEVHRSNRIDWSHMWTIDEYGYESALSYELTADDVEQLNAELTEAGFDVQCDPQTYTFAFGSPMTAEEHFHFAYFMLKNYGYYSKLEIPTVPGKPYDDPSSPYYPNSYLYYANLNALYSDIEGDVNGDGVIDTFDLVLLRKKLKKK